MDLATAFAILANSLFLLSAFTSLLDLAKPKVVSEKVLASNIKPAARYLFPASASSTIMDLKH